jgi:DNA-binding NtrC family response regulator
MAQWATQSGRIDRYPRQYSLYPEADTGRPATRAAVLVVESDDLVRDVVTRALQSAGYVAFGRRDAGEAHLLLAAIPVSACVVEQYLAGGANGMQLFRWLRQRHADLPVVMTSGRSDPVVAEQMRPDPAARFLAKPFGARQLIEIVGELVAPRLAATAA